MSNRKQVINTHFSRLTTNKRNSDTADKNADYIDKNHGMITFLANEERKTVEFEIKDDNVAELKEMFVVSLEAVDASTTIIGSKSEATVNIEDNDESTYMTSFLSAIKEDFYLLGCL